MSKVKLWTSEELDIIKAQMNFEDKRKRHDIRYACFRLQTEAGGGKKADKAHHDLGKELEALEGFEGWDKFADSWDVSTVSPIALIKRKWSVQQEWQQTLSKVALELPAVKDSRGA